MLEGKCFKNSGLRKLMNGEEILDYIIVQSMDHNIVQNIDYTTVPKMDCTVV